MDISLYGILDPEHSSGRPLPELALAALRGGATMLQLRMKRGDRSSRVLEARRLFSAIDGMAPLIINDDVELVAAVGADGVHLGQSDMPVAQARERLGADVIIGLTIGSLDDARQAPVDLIDYACIGGVFDTTSKDNPAAIGVEGWSERAAILRDLSPDLPLGAIAGITAGNAGALIRAGADGVSVISSIFGQVDVEAATRDLARAIADA